MILGPGGVPICAEHGLPDDFAVSHPLTGAK